MKTESLFEPISRSAEAWGPLADIPDRTFQRTLESRKGITKKEISLLAATQKKKKPYKVQFVKEWRSAEYEILSESKDSVYKNAEYFFEQNKDHIGFHDQSTVKGYNKISISQ
jgi:predicted nucleic acid-binding protein